MIEQREEISSQEQWVGQPAAEIVRKIVEANPQISKITVVQYCCLYSSNYDSEIEEETPGELGWEVFEQMSRKAVLGNFIYFTIANALDLQNDDLGGYGGYAVGVASKVELDSGKKAQIPMLDFYIRQTPEHLEILKKRLSENNFPPGFIVNSGGSYHYWGIQLLGPREWLNWLKRISAKESPIFEMIDHRWVERSLNSRCGYLRIAPSDNKKQPKIEALI